MTRNLVQDVKQQEQKSIRHIPITISKDKPRTAQESKPKPEPKSREKKPFSHKKILWIAIVLCVVAIFLGVLNYYSGAHIKILRKTISDDIDQVFRASKDGELPFEVVTISKDLTTSLTATDEKIVNSKASGKIVVYNNSSETPRTLVANTRFESTSGLIYRINKSIIVPGKTTVSGKSVPGQLEATVYADKEGDTYNINLTDFTLPGLKGSASYDTVYARSRTPMTGGSTGNQKTVSEAKAKTAIDTLKSGAEKELLDEAVSQTPKDFILFAGAEKVQFENIPQKVGTTANTVIVGVRASFTGAIMKRSIIAKQITKKLLPSFDNADVTVQNLDDLAFSFKTKIDSFTKLTSFDFNLKGKPRIVWDVDPVKLKTSLVDQPRKNLSTVLSTFKGIEKAEASILPFWKSYFPGTVSKITVENVSSL